MPDGATGRTLSCKTVFFVRFATFPPILPSRTRALSAARGWPVDCLNRKRRHANGGTETRNDLASLRNEPACAHNKEKGQKTGCPKAQPGATQGGCCFDGARNVLLPIADAAHLVHGPIGCTGSSWDNRGTRSSGSSVFRIGMTTDLSEMDAILGRGADKLYRAIGEAVAAYRPAAVFVYITCIPAMQGDDFASVVKKASEKYGVPVIAVDCAGFYGNKNLGNRVAADAICKYVIGTREPPPPPASAERPGIVTHSVNLIGEWNVGGEFWNVAPLFDRLGLRILCCFSGDSRFAEVQTMHRAEANMVVCSKAMLSVARRLKEDYGTPYFESSFYGMADTSAALRRFAYLLDDPSLTIRTEELIASEEARVRRAIAPSRERLKGKRALIFAGGFKSWSLVSAMHDLGVEVVATGIEKSTAEDKARIHALMGEKTRLISDNDQTALIAAYRESGADILIAGDRYIYPAWKSGIPLLDIDHVRRIGYAGYEGMIELARNLDRAVNSPVWRAVSAPPPWESGGAGP
jgi:nitrogenase molybdenum-iron cofactor biosynthesis protein NifE